MRFWAFQILRLPALEWPIFHPSMENGPFKNRKNLAKSTKINSYIKWVWNLPTVMIHLPCYCDSPPQFSQPRVLLLTALASSDADIRLRRKRLCAWDFCYQSTPHSVLIHTYFGCSTPTSCWIIMIPNSNFCKESEPQKQKLELNIFSINIRQCHEIQQFNTVHAIQQKNNPS